MNFDKIFGVTPTTPAPTNVDISGKDTSRSGLGFDALPEGQLPSATGVEEDTEYMGAERVKNIVPDPVLGYRDKNAPFRISEMGGIYDPLTKKATTDETDLVTQREQKLINMQGYASRINKLVKGEPVIISNINQPVGPGDSTETSRIISSKPGLEQSLFGLADTENEFVDVLNQKLGEGNFRYVFDKDAALLEPKFYVSVKREDDTFTPYSTVTKTFTDGLARGSINLAYEAGASIAVFGGAVTLAAAAGSLPVAGFVLAPVVLAYSLYTGGKGKEAFRNFIKDQGLGIRDEELNPAMDYLDKLVSILTPGAGTSMEELSGLLETIPLVGRLKSTFKLMKDGVAKKLNTFLRDQATPGNYESAVASSKIVQQSKADGSDLNIGIPLESLIFNQIKDNVIVDRLAGLASQTVAIIPAKVRAQMQSAAKYLNQYKFNVGEGNFGAFREAVNNVGDYYTKMKTKATARNFSDVGTSLIELDNIFRYLRARESRGLYNKVFDKTKNSVYNLDKIREKVPTIDQYIAPVTDKKGKKMTAELFPPEKGEAKYGDLTRIFLRLGRLKIDKNGNVVEEAGKVTGANLTRQSVTAAIKAYRKLYPDEILDTQYIETNPGKILQLFASKYGKLARDVYGEGGSAPNGTLRENSILMRNAILDLIGNPNKKIPGIANDLKAANQHYKRTFDLTSSTIQTQARIATKRGTDVPEPGEVPTALIGTRGATGTGPSVSPTQTITNLAEIEDYVTRELSKLTDDNVAKALKEGTKTPGVTKEAILGLTQLRNSFREVVDAKLLGIGQRNIDEAQPDTALISFLDRFDPKALRNLGISEAEEQEARRASRTITELFRGGFREATGVDLDAATKFGTIFANIVQSPQTVTTNLRKMIDAAKLGKPPADSDIAMENLRRGLLDGILSRESGVFESIAKNTPQGRVGTDRINANNFINIVRTVQDTPIFKEILTTQDFEVLKGLSTYVATIQKSAADAGSALSGAQIIGNLFTLDPSKFISGLARLSAQKNMSKLFTNDTFVQIMSGLGDIPAMTNKQKIKEIFFGDGAVGQAVATIALAAQREQAETPAVTQTKRMLDKKPTMDFDSIYGVTP